MNISKVLFILDNNILQIKCSKEDKMSTICQEYSKNISKNMNSLIFLYEANTINFELSFENYANNKDEITIIVYKKDKEKAYNILNNNKIEFNKIKSKYIIQIIFSFMFEKI